MFNLERTIKDLQDNEIAKSIINLKSEKELRDHLITILDPTSFQKINKLNSKEFYKEIGSALFIAKTTQFTILYKIYLLN